MVALAGTLRQDFDFRFLISDKFISVGAGPATICLSSWRSLPVKVNSVLCCKSPQDLCRHRRITVTPNFTGQMGFCPFSRFFPARICVVSAIKPPLVRKFLSLSALACSRLHFSVTICRLKFFVFLHIIHDFCKYARFSDRTPPPEAILSKTYTIPSSKTLSATHIPCISFSTYLPTHPTVRQAFRR